MTVQAPPDAERLVIAWALANSTVATSVSNRIYSVIPAAPTFPLIRIVRIGGSPVASKPLWLDQAVLQVDVWGGPKATTHDIAQTIRAHMADSLQGKHTLGYVTTVEFGEFQWLPDASYDPSKPRYSFDVSIFTHP